MIRNYKKIIIGMIAFLFCAAIVFSISPKTIFAAGTCTVTSATFDPGMTWGVKSIVDTGNQPDPLNLNGQKFLYAPYFYPPAPITVTITTQNCVGQKIYVRIASDYNKGDEPLPELIDNLPSPSSDYFTGIFVVPSTGQFSVNFETGEASCGGSNPGCSDYIAAGTKKPRFTKADSGEYVVTAGDYYSKYDQSDHSKSNPNGLIAYNCSGIFCGPKKVWKYDSDTSDKSDNTNKTTLQTNGPTNGGSCTGDTTGSCYQFYDGLTGIFGALGTTLTKYTQATTLGQFLNDIIALIIGIAGVIAVVRIMYLGVVYMKSDNVTNKLTVRGAIIQTVGGFILLLLIYVIFNTINPDLLNLTPSIGVQTLTSADKMALALAGTNTSDPNATTTESQLAAAKTTLAKDTAYIASTYDPARDQQLPNARAGLKLLITAHAIEEGFYPKTISWVTNNPGNIGNNGNGSTPRVCSTGITAPESHSSGVINWVCYPTLGQGIQAQATFETRVASGNVAPYTSTTAGYDGSLGAYLNLYEGGVTSPTTNGTNYLNFFINYFATNGITITGQTQVSQIVNGSSS